MDAYPGVGMSDQETTKDDGERINLERYRIRLGFWQAVWGTLISGGVAVAIPAAVDAYKVRLEITLKDREIQQKSQESHQSYISNFLNTALNQDIELRLRFAEYFSFVSDERNRSSWSSFYTAIKQRRDSVRTEINTKENSLLALQIRTNRTMEEEVRKAFLEREIAWNYAEIGYVRQNSNVTAPSLSRQPSIEPADVIPENEELFRLSIIKDDHVHMVTQAVAHIVANKPRYDRVSEATDVPWYLIGILHRLEAGGNFERHFHNRDPLTDRTIAAPAGRPTEGQPPFTWEDSAIDALRQKNVHNSKDMFLSPGGILYILERYNGFGYRRFHAHVKSPYVWSGTQYYTTGTYLANGMWSDTTQVKQFGGAALLKQLVTLNHISFR